MLAVSLFNFGLVRSHPFQKLCDPALNCSVLLEMWSNKSIMMNLTLAIPQDALGWVCWQLRGCIPDLCVTTLTHRYVNRSMRWSQHQILKIKFTVMTVMSSTQARHHKATVLYWGYCHSPTQVYASFNESFYPCHGLYLLILQLGLPSDSSS